MTVFVSTQGSGGALDPLLLPPVQRVIWPASDNGYSGGGFETKVTTLDGGERLWFAVQGDVRTRIFTNSLYARLGKTNIEVNEDQLVSADAGGSGSRMMPLLAQHSTSARIPLWRRMAYFQVSIRLLDTTVWGQMSGIIFRPHESGVIYWSQNAGNVDRSGIGIVGNGAGAWKWCSKVSDNLGPMDEQINLTWPVALTQWCTVTVVFVSATATAFGKVQLWLGESLTLERSYDAAGSSLVLPRYEGSGNWIHAILGYGATSPGMETWMRDYEFGYGGIHPMTGEILTGR